MFSQKLMFLGLRKSGLKPALSGLLCVAWVTSSFAQALSAKESGSEKSASSQLLNPGVVIEKFDDDFSAAKSAGMREGDVLLSWSRGPASGRIESPFDVSLVVTEQFPLGNVAFEGLRGSERKTWEVVKKWWGTEMRPNFSEAALATYEAAVKKAEAGKPVSVEPWSLADSQRSAAEWLGPWFFSNIARILAAGHHGKEADEAYQRAIQVSDRAPAYVKVQLLEAWGWQLYSSSDLGRAAQSFESAIENDRKEDTPNLMADALRGLGSVARDRGDLSRSADYFAQALAIIERIEPGSLDMAQSLINAALVRFDRGDLVEAETYYQQAFTIFRERAPRGVGAAIVLNNLGEIAQLRGDLDKAATYLRQALVMIDEVDPGTTEQASFMRSLAGVLQDEGNLTEAGKYLRDSLVLEEKLEPGSPGETEAYQALGNLARKRGDLKTAESSYQRALEISQKLETAGLRTSDALYGLGEVAADNSELVQAESYHRQALAIRESLAPQSEKHADSLAALGSITKRQGSIEKASAYYELALDALENQAARLGGAEDERAAFRALHLRYYREYIDLLIGLRRPELAFGVLERLRARTLLEMLTGAQIDIHKGADPGLIARERSLRADIKAKSERRIHLLTGKHTDEEIKAVEKEIDNLAQEYQAVEGQLRLRSPNYAALTQPQPLDARAVQHLLPEDTVLFEYVLGDEGSYVFAVTPGSLNVYELPKKVVIEQLARNLYRFMTERGRTMKGETEWERSTRWKKADAKSQKGAAELSAMILKPLAEELRNRKLLIVSDGALQYVPFAALPAPGLRIRTTPLIAQHEIISLPSASVLALLLRKHGLRTINKEVAVLADPVFGLNDSRLQQARLAAVLETDGIKQPENEKTSMKPSFPEVLARSVADTAVQTGRNVELPRLAFTRDESNAIMATLPPGRGLEALGFDATRKLAVSGELSRYRIVHFATHALVDNIHPELSGLVLSLVDEKGNPVNGFLDLDDIYNLDLSADLVVLSACQTALGKEVNGEGLIGLTRGFMYAGAPRVISTLWKVDDFATAKLMARFYKAMEQERMRPAQALRQAQLSLWKETYLSAPYYWAGFLIQGDWQ